MKLIANAIGGQFLVSANGNLPLKENIKKTPDAAFLWETTSGEIFQGLSITYFESLSISDLLPFQKAIF